MTFTQAIKNKAKSTIKFNNWFFNFFIKNPQFELYAKKLGLKNKHFFKIVLDDRNKGIDTHLDKYSFNEIPKKVWIYWEQGEDNAPIIVKNCIESWIKHNPDWEITIIDSESLSQFLEMPSLPECLPVRYYANLLRLKLLNKYGGVWADATTYCHRPLNDWLPLLAYSGLFMFRNPGPDRLIENWFIASTPENLLIKAWENALSTYYNKQTKVHPTYFLAFYLFQWILEKNSLLKSEFDKASGLNAGPTFIMKSVMNSRTNIDQFLKHIKIGLPVSKLDWRTELTDEQVNNFFVLIEDKLKF